MFPPAWRFGSNSEWSHWLHDFARPAQSGFVAPTVLPINPALNHFMLNLPSNWQSAFQPGGPRAG